ncbi:hypothetical protein BKA57DRAFT_479561 [Linnemannia elongata]|nr:hypothetical protein BKA57DRAFT_479561 [Linnemannia elongata]
MGSPAQVQILLLTLSFAFLAEFFCFCSHSWEGKMLGYEGVTRINLSDYLPAKEYFDTMTLEAGQNSRSVH